MNSIAKPPSIVQLKAETESTRLMDSKNHKDGKNPLLCPVSDLEAAGHTKTPLAKVIRKKCLECCGFQAGEVRKCHMVDCPLWPYRMGKNPFQSHKVKEGAE